MAEYITKLGSGTATRRRAKEKIEQPRKYKVLLHNDNYTTMEFVVQVLEDVFHKKHSEAFRIMLNVHETGMGVAGIYVKAIAETKVEVVHSLARDRGYPLKCSAEPE